MDTNPHELKQVLTDLLPQIWRSPNGGQKRFPAPFVSTAFALCPFVSLPRLLLHCSGAGVVIQWNGFWDLRFAARHVHERRW